MPFLRSETVHQLRQILDYLPRQRRRALLLLVPFSVVPGVLDLLSVAVVARLTGALVGSGLEDRLSGVWVFGGNLLNQSLWLILIFIVLAWLAPMAPLTPVLCRISSVATKTSLRTPGSHLKSGPMYATTTTLLKTGSRFTAI